jgi:hypothetical protein
MHSRKLYTSLVILIIFIAVFFLKQNFLGEKYQDEHHYLDTAVFFSKEPIPSADLLKSYNELNTPVPFILGGWIVSVFGENIQSLRLLTFAVSFALLMIFVWGSPDHSKHFFLCLAGLMVFPNYYLCSVYYYTDIFAMIGVLAGVVAYIRKAHGWAMIFFILAVASRQYMLAFPAAIVAYEFLGLLKNDFNIRAFLARIFTEKTWLPYALAVLSIVPWILLWKGPAPAAVMADQYYDSDKLIQYNFGYVLYSSACLAVYYIIPEVLITGHIRYFLDFPKNHPRLFIGYIIVIGALIALFPAKQAYNPYFTWPYLGYVDQLFMTLGITGFVKQIVFGLLMLITMMRFFSPYFNLASCVVLINILLLGKAQLSWDKYSLPMIMVLWFLTMFDRHWLFTASDRKDKLFYH